MYKYGVNNHVLSKFEHLILKIVFKMDEYDAAEQDIVNQCSQQ